MLYGAVLLALVPAALCALVPEKIARPSIRQFSTISGICDTNSGTISGETWTDRAGTLRACAKRCSDLSNCKGFNFFTDNQQCQLFQQACDNTNPVGRLQPNQNFYVRGEIECSTSTEGKEFYVAFMANRVQQPKNMPLEIWITQDQSDRPIIVNMTIDSSMVSPPGTANGIRSEVTQIIVPSKTAVPKLIPYTWKVTDIDRGVTKETKALRFSSDTEFVLYGVNKEYFTADTFLGVPSNALGTRYVVTCHWPPFYNCEFAIATADNHVTVTITLPRAGTTRNTGKWELDPMASKQDKNLPPVPKCSVPHNGRTYTNGESFRVELDLFEVAQIQDLCDLTGTVIEADGHIAVWSGDSRVNVGDSPSRDHVVDQLFSTDTWGFDCAAWPTPNRLAGLVDTWVVTAAADGTRVRVDSTELPTTYYDLNAGESVRFPANSVNEWMRFSSADKKIQVAQYSHSAQDPKIPGDPSLTICIPSDQFGFGYTFITPTGVSSNYTNFLTIITKDTNQNGFLLDNQPMRGIKWNKIPNSNLVGGYYLLDTSSKTQFRVNHTTVGTNFEAYIYGSGDRESIAYPTGACIRALGDCIESKMFLADGKDNDCDGVIDEELLDGIDNDFDGKVDEDCYDKKPIVIATERCPKVLNATACFGSQLQLNCDDGNNIAVLDAHFGRIGIAGELTCNAENTLDACSGTEAVCGFTDVSDAISTQCNGKTQCSMTVNLFSLGNLFAPSRCPTCSLYAHVQYACLNQKEQNTATLSGSNYQASTWLSSKSAGTCSAASTGTAGCAGCSSMVDTSVDPYHPSQADFKHTSNPRGWRPSNCDKDSSWLQVDLGGQYSVGWYAISGCRKEDHWITQFAISYSADGVYWSNVTDGGALKRFDGNVDAINVKVCTLFGSNIVARYLAIYPLSYNGAPCAHVDFGHGATLQGCMAQPVANSNFAKGGTTGFNTAATVTCSRGWSTRSGATSYIAHCDTAGHWLDDFQDCNKPISCPDIPQVDGGYGIAKNNLVGSVVTFGCLDGRRLSGATKITCRDNGQWSEKAPTCS